MKTCLMKIWLFIKRINEAQTAIDPDNALGSAGEGFVRLSYASTPKELAEEPKLSGDESKKL